MTDEITQGGVISAAADAVQEMEQSVSEIAPANPSRRHSRPSDAIIQRSANQNGFYGMTGYKSARVIRNIDKQYATNAAGFRHEQVSRERLIAESRAFVRDNLLYRGIMQRCIDFMVGDGFKLAAQNKILDELWERDYYDIEITGRYKGGKLDRAVAMEWLTTGEGVGLKVTGGKVQLIESEQIVQRNTNARPMGIETDQYGRPVNFQIASYINGSLGRSRAISAKNVLFICERERPSSVRGMPVLQQAFPMLHRINDVLDSEALGFQILSRIVLKHLTDTGTGLEPVSTAAKDADNLEVREMPFGLIFEGNIDDVLEPMERGIPGKDFPQSITTFCRFLGLPLGIPLEIVLLDWTKSNFSQMRGALMMADKRFHGMQDIIINDWHEPLFQWKFNQYVAQGLIEDIPENREHEWIRTPFPWVEPEKEAIAQGKMIELGLETHTNACKARSRERARMLPQLKKEITEAITIANEIEADTGVKVPWQPFAGHVVGKTESAVMAGQDDEKDDSNADK